jgi:uncharacterized cupredoxin-like copper-binding protein
MSRRSVYRVVPAVVAALVLGALAAPALVQAKATAHTAATTITVSAKEFKFTLSKSSAKTGKVTFKVTNKGTIPHDFKINNVKTKLIQPGLSSSLTVNFKKAGKYPYECTVPGHAAAGMKGTFKVT